MVFCDVLAKDNATGSVGITPGSAALRRETHRSLAKARPRIIDGAARCVSLTLRPRDFLRGGHVLGLRRLLDDQSFEVDAGKRPHIASKAEAEATPRVDVGEVSMTLVSRGGAPKQTSQFPGLCKGGREDTGRSSLGGYACLRVACSGCLSSSCFT